jgi:arabinogalactan oligomer/maltooligosaccharide transport system permease protein
VPVIATVLALCFVLLTASSTALAQARVVQLWHSYRGAEQDALNLVVARFMDARRDVRVETLAVPFDAYASKLEAAIPHGHGPDVFIDAHERLASYRDRQLVAPLGELGLHAQQFESATLDAFVQQQQVYGLPLATKSLVLFINESLYQSLQSPPLDTLEQLEALRRRLPSNVYPLVYYAQNAYFHEPFLSAFGGSLFDTSVQRYAFVGDAAERSLQRVQQMIERHVVPEEADGAQVAQYFRAGRALTAISGPWFVGELQHAGANNGPMPFRVVALPRLASGRQLRPYMTVEGAFLSAHSQNRADAMALIEALVATEGAVVRAQLGRQVVATRAAWEQPALAQDPVLSVFRQAALSADVMPSHPHMRLTFEPANQAIRRALREPAATRSALAAGARRFAQASRPPAPRRDPTLYLLALGVLTLWACARAVNRAKDPTFRAQLRQSATAYRYTAHAVVVLLLLVVAPLTIGALTSLCAGRNGELYFVGLNNYWQILTAGGEQLFSSGSFYLVLVVNILWTVANLALHMALGVALALVLSRPWVKMRALYRVLLIVPWAVPSYVTALAWKGMFQRQSGAINALLRSIGAEPVSWFAQFSTAFTANLLTNTWLGFPFMMVVTLGALTSIPKDLYEAAGVDGATPWQQFKLITVPLLKPTLLPAASMGAVWTFNQFNVIFLVSGGEPDGATEILVTEAYRWAFTRQAQYGYAAAYSVLIFAVLVLLTRGLERATGVKK